MDSNRKVVLPALYYLDNFDQIVEYVRVRYDDLLDLKERRQLDRVSCLSQSARGLLVRFFTRKGWLFRTDKLVYPELGELSVAIKELISARLIYQLSDSENEQSSLEILSPLMALYNKGELLKLVGLSDWEVPPGIQKLKRAELEQEIMVLAKSPDLLLRLQKQLVNSVIAVDESLQGTLRLLNLLYFGNMNQTLTEFVLRDLGVQRYQPVALGLEDRGFDHRAALNHHVSYYGLLERLPNIADTVPELLIELSAEFQNLNLEVQTDSRLKRRTYRQLSVIARQLERFGEVKEALSIYQNIPQHPARERVIRILSKNNPLEALNWCRRAWLCPYSDDERAFLEGFIPRLIKRLVKAGQIEERVPWFQEPNVLAEEIVVLTKEQKLNIGQRGFIESAALYHLGKREPGQGFHVENALFCAVFGLMFWPVIFASVKGAFFHPFQSQPDDFGEPDFWHKREQQADKVWDKLSRGSWRQDVRAEWKRSKGIVNPLVHWGFLEQVQANGCWDRALERIPDTDWIAIFRYLAGDLKSRSKGMPDLIWFPNTGSYQLFEVKGPGDTLRQSQIGWLRYLQREDVKIDAKVLYAD